MRRPGIYLCICFLIGISLCHALGGERGLPLTCLLLPIAASMVVIVTTLRESLSIGFNLLLTLSAGISLLLCGAGRYAVADKTYEGNIARRITAQATKLREAGEERIREIFPMKEESDVAIALTLGDKRGMSSSIKASFKEAGVMHTLALSGLHTGIIWSIVNVLLSVLRLNARMRPLKPLIASIFIGGYALLTGFTPSVTRACIMLAVYGGVEFFCKRADKFTLLCATAFIICLVNPYALFMVGFQLSFAATAGIVLLYPTISKSIGRIFPPRKGVREILRKMIRGVLSAFGITTVCQITTIPFLLIYFGSIPEEFLLSNIVAVPLVTLSLYGIIATIIVSPIPILRGVMATGTIYILRLLIKTVGFLAT